MQESFDRERLLDQVDGDFEFLQETMEMLEEDAPGLIDDVTRAAGDGDASALAPAHAMKSMVGNFCAGPAQDAALRLEKMGRENRLDDAEAAARQLRLEVEQLISALHTFIEGAR